MREGYARAVLLRWIPPLAYTAWLLKLGTAPPSHDLPLVNDKLAHALGFGVLAVLLLPALSWRVPTGQPRWRGVAASALCATLVGAALEVWQAFLPVRRAEWLDLLADAGGALAGATLASWSLQRLRLRRLARTR